MASAGGLMMLAVLGGTAPTVPANSTLYVAVRAPFPEIEPFDVFSQLSGRRATLRETVNLIRRARDDDRVTAVVLTVEAAGALWAQLHEVRTAIDDLRASGKPVTAYLEYGGPPEYYVASGADRVVMMPGGQLDLTGLVTYELFFRSAFDKIGILPDMLQIGEYKTAANVYEQKGFTEAHREMSTSLNHDWLDQLVGVVAAGRGLSQDAARAAVEGGPYGAQAALEAGLVDALGYADELDDEAPIRGTRRLTSDDYARSIPSTTWRSGGRIALLYAAGTIASGRSSYDGMGGQVVGSETFTRWLQRVREDRSILAVVVRIDSPGGSAIASEAIWREMKLTRDVKPLIVSMGDVAASGGYYIAAPAHQIVAQPGTITGSIGVVAGKFVLEGVLDKLGIGVGVIAEGPLAEIYSPLTPFSPDERTRMEAQMRETYDLFLSRVSEGRDRTVDEIDAVGQGRVWTGRQALERGLVDEMGGLSAAIRIARERARIDPARDVDLVVYPPKRTVFEVLANPLGTVQAGLSLRERLGGRSPLSTLESAAEWLSLFRRGEPLALMPNLFWN